MACRALIGLAIAASPAAAQRVEVAFLGGTHQAYPIEVVLPARGICGQFGCINYYRVTHRPGAMWGARVTVELGTHWGFDVVWQHSAGTARLESGEDPAEPPTNVTTRWTDVKVFALQPHVRFRLSDETQAVLGVGPAEADVGPVGGTGYGVAMSLSLRARPARFMSFEARVSNTHVFGQQEIRDHLFVGAGLALALKP